MSEFIFDHAELRPLFLDCASVQNTDDQKWLFWNIGNQIAMDQPEANRTGAEIGPEVAGKRSSHGHVDGLLDFI